MKTEIKICGLSTCEGIDAAVNAGAGYFGLVHFRDSPRHVSIEQAIALKKYAPPEIKSVLLLVNASAEVTGHAIDLVKPDIVQFHGTETPEWLAAVKQHSGLEIWKAIGLRDRSSLLNCDKYQGAADRIIFDAPAGALPGGNGTRVDWSLLAQFDHRMPWGLAGGLSPDNVAEAMQATRAAMVDVSSGVESEPGVKNVDKIAAFCKAVRAQHDPVTHTN